MPILGGQSLYKSYGDRDILAGASLTIEAGERLGLVGSNGSGKTTLARILAGSEEPDRGEVTRGRDITLAYLSQNPEMDGAAEPVDVVLSGLTAWTDAMVEHERISAALGEPNADLDTLLAQQEAAAATVERLGGWDLRYQAETMLDHLGVPATGRSVGTMSGGERRRIALARLLIARPDIAVLDEPTNHLDIPTIEWLERYLIDRFTGALLLITHDRYLLDNIVNRTVELDRGELFSYDGGWEQYLVGHAERMARSQRAEANRQNFLRRELEWLRRQPKARTGKQKARVNRAHAVIDTDGPLKDQSAMIAVGTTRTGKTVLDARNLSVDIGGKRLVEDLTLMLGKGERIGIIGPNGAGKTTMIRALLGEIEPAAGKVVIGKNTKVAYLDQTRAGLDDDDSVFNNVSQGQVQVTLGDNTMEMRSYLYRFLFDNEAQKRHVGTLSGGERARVALARVLRESANLVVLDEPTNDLDVATLGALEASLLDFGGTALVVTHDRWFLDRVATAIISFEGEGRVVHVHGTYGDYQTWRKRDQADSAAAEPAPKQAAAKPKAKQKPKQKRKGLSFDERHELAGIMDKIDEAEAQVASLEAGLATAEFSQRSYSEQAAYAEELAQARTRAEALVERWSELEAIKEQAD